MNDKLNDILMNNGEDPKSKNAKKLILLIIAIVVLVIAIAAISLSLSSSDTKEEEIVDTNMTTDMQSVSPNTNEFTNVPVNDDNMQFEQIVKEIRSRQQNATDTDMATTTPSPITSSNAEKIQMPDKAQQATSTKIKSQPKVKSTTGSSSVAKSMSRNNNGDIAENGIYLQVGAFSKTPNKQFLDSINKYSYRIQEIMINSKVITRYLIGPYANRNAAQKDMNSISRDITTPVLLEVQ